MKNTKNLVVGLLCAVVAALPYRKGWARDEAKDPKLRALMAISLGIGSAINLWYFSETNSNIMEE